VLPLAGWVSPNEPGFVPFGVIVGGLLGRVVAWRLRYDADKTVRTVVDGGQLGAAIALAVYVLVNLVETSFG